MRGTAKSRDLLSIQTSVETLNAQSMNAEQALVDSVEATAERRHGNFGGATFERPNSKGSIESQHLQENHQWLTQSPT